MQPHAPELSVTQSRVAVLCHNVHFAEALRPKFTMVPTPDNLFQDDLSSGHSIPATKCNKTL